MPDAPKGPEDPTIISEETSEKAPETKKEATAEEKLPSIEDIKGYTEDLKRRIDEAKAEKEKNIVGKIQEREALIGEAVKNDEFLLETRGTLKYYRAMKELGELPSKEDAKRLEGLEELGKTLEGREFEIKKQIYTIAQHPEVKERLEKETREIVREKQEEIEASNKLEQVKEEAALKTEALAEEIKNLVEERVGLNQEIEKSEKELSPAVEEMEKMIKEAKIKLSSRYEWMLDSAAIMAKDGFKSAEELEKFFKDVEERKKSTGIFSGYRDRAIIKFILNRKEALKTVHEKAVRRQALSNAKDDIWYKKTRLVGRGWSEVVDEAAAKSEGIRRWQGTMTNTRHFESLTSLWMREKINEFVDIKRPDPQNPEKSIGKYKTMEEAEKADPRNKYLFEIHARVADFYRSERKPRGY